MRPPVYVPLYDPDNTDHTALAKYSRVAHEDSVETGRVLAKIDEVYRRMCLRRNNR